MISVYLLLEIKGGWETLVILFALDGFFILYQVLTVPYYAIVMLLVPGMSSISYLSNSISFRPFGGLLFPIKV